MNSITQTIPAVPPVAPEPPISRAQRLGSLLRLAASTTPVPGDSIWPANPAFGGQSLEVIRQIRESVAFTAGRSRLEPEMRPYAAPFAFLNRAGSYEGAFYRNVLRDGPRRLVEPNGPASAQWRRPSYQPVREALTRPDARVGNHLARLAQLGVDAGIGVFALARVLGWMLLGQFGRAGMVAHIHGPHLGSLALALGVCAVVTLAVL